MVSPFYILIVGLGLTFLLGLSGKKQSQISSLMVILAMTFFTAVSSVWVHGFLSGSLHTTMVYSAGFKPPFSISLLVGKQEAFISLLVNVLGLFSAIYLKNPFKGEAKKLGAVLVVLFMGLNMLIFARDLFNIFVFLEIVTISMSGLLLLDDHHRAHSAGFKYLLASALISAFYLLGAVLTYYITGTLYLDDILGMPMTSPMAGIASFFIIIAVIIELKPFPANGWALDAYQAAHPGVGAILSGASATTMLFLLWKLLGMGSEKLYLMTTAVGAITFLFSNWMGIQQKDPNRLLGYSSIGQVGLVMSIIGLKPMIGEGTELIAFGILVTHFFAKAGLFWLSGIVNGSTLESWTVIRRNPILLVVFGLFIFALSSFPPFPSFYAKWELIIGLASHGRYLLMGVILFGSLLEAIYLFRWFGIVVKVKDTESTAPYKIQWNQIAGPILFSVFLLAVGFLSRGKLSYPDGINFLPLLPIIVLWVIDFLPVWIKNTLLLASVLVYSWFYIPQYSDYQLIFGIIFLAGAFLTLIYGYSEKGKRTGFYPLAAMMFGGLIMLVEAETLFGFFFAWEIMTAGSYFLILRGKKSQPHALSYLLFSVGGALLILAGFAMAHSVTGLWTLDALIMDHPLSPWIFILLALGFLTKTAAIGLHIWLPGAHGEAEADVSPMVSGILLKAGVFGLIILFLRMGNQHIGGLDLMVVLSWIGVISALIGNLMAAMQEDMKRLLAYSSVGQLGYILFGLSLMSNLGWLLAISGAIMHFMYKTMLFQSVGGVYSRTHDRMMYRMGGLIFRMPFTFFVVMIGIIAMSGVPPLSGFAGKWLSFNAVLQKEFYLQGAVAVIAGAIAFLYLFRLIHAPFLGQLKDHLRKVKEASFWILLPQFIVILFIMVVSTIPGILLERIGKMLTTKFPDGGLLWVESKLPFGARTAISEYGYWNGTYVMIVTMGIFGILLGIHFLLQRRNRKVGQFNIVYSGERPSTPETTHHAYNFYAHYSKALGFLMVPFAEKFWEWVSNLLHDGAQRMRQLYTGNGQTYLMHIMIFFLVCYFLINGGLI
jgi:formate hydrogenlyase subunit 3/multisubunit Na+/H+ antiporter MnhD subunit